MDKIDKNIENEGKPQNYILKFIYFVIDFIILISVIIILKYVISKIRRIILHYDEYNKVMVVQDDSQI